MKKVLLHTAIGFFLLLVGILALPQKVAHPSTPGPTSSRYSGYGGVASASDPCVSLNGVDLQCMKNTISNWVAQGIVDGMEPVLDLVLHAPIDIVFYTDPILTYNDPSVQTFYNWVDDLVNSALLIFVMIAGYNIMRGYANYYANIRALPALAIAAVAAHFGLSLVQPLIDINNGICDYFRMNASVTVLKNYYEKLFTPDMLLSGWPIMLFIILLAGLILTAYGQMITRIVIIDLLIIFMAAWMICFGLEQAEFIARPMSRALLLAIFVQSIQVGALCLAGMLFSALSFNGSPLLSLLFGISIIYMIVRIPHMLGASTVMRDAASSAGRTVLMLVRTIVALA